MGEWLVELPQHSHVGATPLFVPQAHVQAGRGGLGSTWVLEDNAALPVRNPRLLRLLSSAPTLAPPLVQSLGLTLPPPQPPYGRMLIARGGLRPWQGGNVKAEVTVRGAGASRGGGRRRDPPPSRPRPRR